MPVRYSIFVVKLTAGKKNKQILEEARSRAYRAVNFTMVQAYWNIGRVIVEDEQKGKAKAGYREYLLKNLSSKLTEEFGRGFDPSNLRYMRISYTSFEICDAVRHTSSINKN